MKKNYLLILLLALLASCVAQKKNLRLSITDLNQFTGYLFVDLSTGDTLLSKHEHHYFIPASTTKIFTLYASLLHPSDSLTAFRYSVSDDTLFVKGMGDPTFLHPDFPVSRVTDFLKKYPKISLNTTGYGGTPYGKGWMWDDASDAYQTEISGFPIYGNLVKMKKSDANFHLYPQQFERYGKDISSIFRWYESPGKWNEFLNSVPDSVNVPFQTNDDLLQFLLQDTLKTDFIDAPFTGVSYLNELKSIPKDTVLKYMMYYSDNMLAEQMLLQAGFYLLPDSILTAQKIIKHLLTSHLSEFSPAPRWVDGSGLSRYNLFTPEHLVSMVSKIKREYGDAVIKTYFPSNGSAGTMNTFLASDTPFMYAKSGSMSGVYNLAGILTTDSGREVVFAVMNNNFTEGVSKVRKATAEFIGQFKERF